MPGGSVGIGFTFFGGRGRLNEKDSCNRKRIHFDGLECFNLFLPYYATRAVHVWDWRADRSNWSLSKRITRFSYRAMPIRWSHELVLRVFLRCWIWVPLWLTGFLAASLAHGVFGKIFALLMLIASVAGYLYLGQLDHRDREIRQLLGRHRFGLSDPFYWTPELLRFVVSSQAWFGTPSFLVAGKILYDQKDFQNAMWAARLATALEDRSKGELLTDQILQLSQTEQVSPTNNQLPRMEFQNGEAGRFWNSHYEGRSQVKFTEQMFANNLFGSLAAAFDSETPDDKTELRQYNRVIRNDPEAGKFKWVGPAIVGGIFCFCMLAAGFANLFLSNPVRGDQWEQSASNVRQGEGATENQKTTDDNPFAPKFRSDRKAPSEKFVSGVPLQIEALGNSGDRLFLVDLPYYDMKPGPWKITKDGTTGERFRRVPITVGGIAFSRGIGMHPPNRGTASVKFALYGQAKSMTTKAALNDSATEVRKYALFEVWGDGRKLWESGRVDVAGVEHDCDIDVSDVDVLELRVISPDDYWSLHAVWCDPVIELK